MEDYHFADDEIDVSCLSKKEQKSRMYRNLLTVFSMCENKPLTYEQVNDYLSSLFKKFTEAKTTCVYWRRTVSKECPGFKCHDSLCEEKGVHRICSRAFHRKKRVIWVQKSLVKRIFKNSRNWISNAPPLTSTSTSLTTKTITGPGVSNITSTS